MVDEHRRWGRRRVLGMGTAFLAVAAGVPGRGSVRARAADGEADPCEGPGPTMTQTAGPFYRSGAPLRPDLRDPDMEGRDLVVRGRVMDPACRGVPDATLDIWQADAEGRYDNRTYRLRGQVRTDATGAFVFRTVRPGAYGTVFVRTPHVHVKVRAGGMRPLTTQLYFPDEPVRNERDSLYRPELLVRFSDPEGGEAVFDFVMTPA